MRSLIKKMPSRLSQCHEEKGSKAGSERTDMKATLVSSSTGLAIYSPMFIAKHGWGYAWIAEHKKSAFMAQNRACSVVGSDVL